MNILKLFQLDCFKKSSNKSLTILNRFGNRIKSKITKNKDFYTIADIDLITEIEQVTKNNQLDRLI